MDPEFTSNRITRILTTDFPQYFAIITRIRQEVHAIGPEGGMVSSTVVPQVQAIFPEGALTKKIKVGLQVGKRRKKENHHNGGEMIEIIEPDGDAPMARKRRGGFGEGIRRMFGKKSKPEPIVIENNHVTANCVSNNVIATIDKSTQTDGAKKIKRIKQVKKATNNRSNNNTKKAAPKLRDGPAKDRFRAPESGGCLANFVRSAVPNLDLFSRMM